VFLYGRVVMDDGSPPPAGIAIKRVCSGTPRTLGYTSAKGQFSISIGGGQQQPGLFDASEGFPGRDGFDSGVPGIAGQSGVGAMSSSAAFSATMAGCELIAELAGFRSDRLSLAARSALDNPDVGIIVLHRIAGVEGTSVSATSLNAPKDARKAWEKGNQILRSAESGPPNSASGKDSKLADAEKNFQSAVTVYPKFANAWNDLGRTRLLRRDAAGAKEAFLKALEADSKLVEPNIALGEDAIRAQDWQTAAKYLGRALQLDSVDYPRVWFEDAVANYNSQNSDRAEKDLREALKLPLSAKVDPRANELLGFILIDKRDYPGAKDALNTYLRLLPAAPDAADIKSKISAIDGELANAAR
jgi:tetratricopeptide (TPR) repeat protein